MNARLGVLALSLPLAGCLKAPPVMHAESIAAPPVPALAAAPEAKTFGWIRAHQIVRTLQRVGAGQLVTQVQRQGIDPGQIDPEKPVVIVVDDPNGAPIQKAPFMGLLPVAPQSQIGNMAMALAGAQNVSRLDGGVAVVLNRGPLDDAHGGGLLRALGGAPLVGDLEVFVHAAAMKTRYAAEIAQAFEKMQAELQKPQKAGTTLDPAFAKAYIDWLRGGLDAIQSVVVGFGAEEKDLDLYVVSREVNAAALPAQARSMPDLGQFVPAGDMRFEFGAGSWSRFVDFAIKLYESHLKDRPDLMARLRAVLDVWSKGESQAAISIQLDGERFLRGSSVLLSSRAEEQMKAMRDGIELMKDEAMQKMMRSMGSEFSITLQQEVRKVEGWPVDHVAYSFKIDESKLGRGQRELMQKMFGKPIEMELVRLGSYLVYTINEPPAALDRIAAELMAGKGSSPSLTARGRQPAGGWLYGDIDVPKLLRDFTQLLPERKRGDVPQLDDRTPPVTIFGYSPGGAGYYRLGVPTMLVDSIRSIATRKSSGGGGGDEQSIPPAPSL